MGGDGYPGLMGYLTGVVAFFAGWIYAVASYGWFLGLGLGWLPAFFVAVIAAYLWPLIALAIAGVIFLMVKP